jgi:serralysin
MSVGSGAYENIARSNPQLGSIPGYNHDVGHDASIALRSFTTLARQPGFYYDASRKILVVTQDGTNLSGVDFRGVSVYVQANDVTISNSVFDASAGNVAVRGMPGYANLTVDHSTFDGLKLDKSFIPIFGLGTNTNVTNNVFTNNQSDVISIAGGRIAGNLISGSGYQTDAHADAISISGFRTNGPILIENNVIDWRNAADARADTNQVIRVASDHGPISDITISRNVILGGSYSVGIEENWGGRGSITGVRITDNVIDAGTWGSLFPSRPADLVYEGNARMTGAGTRAGSESEGPSVDALTTGLATFTGTAGNDALSGKEKAESFKGGAGQDWISAGNGNDVIEGGSGRDYLIGGAGKDVFVYRSFDTGRGDQIYDFTRGEDRIHLAELPGAPAAAAAWTWLGSQEFTGQAWQLRQKILSDGTTLVELDRDGDMRADFQIEFNGTHQFTTADFILGAAAPQPAPTPPAPPPPVLSPEEREAAAHAGADRITGTTGADELKGYAGDDTYIVDNAGDRIVEAANQGNDTVLASVTYKLADGQSIENLYAADAASRSSINLTGNDIDNTIRGSAAGNWIDGGKGADKMIGLGGNDAYVVDNVGDQVIEAAGGGTDTVHAAVSYTLAEGQEIEILAARNVNGTTPLSLTGNAFANTIKGGAGADFLDGGAGADMLQGLGGRDTFVFRSALDGSNVDHIADFSQVDDTIQLSASVFTTLAPGALQAGAFSDITSGSAMVDADDRILYDAGTGALYYDADGSGAALAVQFAILDNKAAINHTDFFVV